LYHERKGSKLRLYITRYACSLFDCLKKLRGNLEQKTVEYFTPSHIINLCKQMCNGVLFLHENSIVHRDLKSQNIFVIFDGHGEIKDLVIGDFDTAKRISTTNKPITLVGTLPYMAPEIILRHKTNDNDQSVPYYSYSADVWSFGMVLFELLTFYPPYFEVSEYSTTDNIIKGIIPNVHDHSNLSQEYDPLIDLYQSCLVIDPDSRPTMKQIKEKLKVLHLTYKSEQ